MTKDLTKAIGSNLGSERRRETRHDVTLNVNYSQGDTYLYSKSSNISEMGIFIVTDNPLEIGATMKLRFDAPSGGHAVDVTGVVLWIDSGEDTSMIGMGIRFVDPDEKTKATIRTLIRTMAYLD